MKKLLSFLLAVGLLSLSGFSYVVAQEPLRVNVMPDGIYNPPVENTAYAWPGKTLTIWGNVHGGTAPYHYAWDFGDGTPVVSGTVTDPRYIAVTHAYTSMGPKIATLSVIDDNGVLDADQVRIDVLPENESVRVNAAIEKGLRWLYLHNYSHIYWQGWAAEGQYRVGAFGMEILAFQNRGHRPTNDIDDDIYAEYVQEGFDILFSLAHTQSIGPQPYGNPDSDGDGVGIYFNDGTRPVYETGIAMMAIVGSGSPDRIATTGPPGVNGLTYAEIVEDATDYCAWAQNESGGGRGGWRYYPNYSSSDNSVSQWPAVGLEAAETNWGIAAPDFVRSELLLWLAYSQNPNGGFGYASNYGGRVNVGLTGAGICELSYCDVPHSDSRIQGALGYINNNWYQGNSLTHGNLGNYYAMYAVAKGCRIAVDESNLPYEIEMIGSHGWQQEYNEYLVTHQYEDGHWDGSNYGSRVLDTGFGVLILTPTIAELRPVAVIDGPYGVPPNTSFPMDARDSYHQDPTKHLVQWLWDFDNSDGVDWNNPDAIGVDVANPGYSLPEGELSATFVVTLRVADDGAPVMTDVEEHSITVSRENHPPVADAGGPYAAKVGETITFDGTNSYDLDEDDYIASYSWDIDGDGVFGDCTDPVCTHTWGSVYSGYVGLKVTDSYGVISDISQGYVSVWTSRMDAGISEGDIIFSPFNPLPYETATVSAVVHCDIVSDPIDVLRVRFYDGDPSISVNQIGDDQLVYTLTAGDCDTVQVDWFYPDTLEHQIFVRIDPDAELEEFNETNNEASKAVSPAPPMLVYGNVVIRADLITSEGDMVKRASGHVNINDFLMFSGDLLIDESDISVSGAGRIYIEVTTPYFTGAIDLYEGDFNFTILGEDGILTNFIRENILNELRVGGLLVELRDLTLLGEGVMIAGSLELPPLLSGIRIDIDNLSVTQGGGIEIVGQISDIPDITIPGAIVLKDLSFAFNTVENSYSGSAYAWTPLVSIGGKASVVEGRLRSVYLEIGLGHPVPIGATGLFLAGGGGGLDNLDSPPIIIMITVDITGGPEVAGVSIVKLDDFRLTIAPPRYIEGGGSLLVFGQQAADGRVYYGAVGLGAEGQINFINVLIADLGVHLKGDRIRGHANGELQIPALEGFPFDLISEFFGLPYVVASTENSLSNDRIQGRFELKTEGFFGIPFNLGLAHRLEFTPPELTWYLGTNYHNLQQIIVIPLPSMASTDGGGFYQIQTNYFLEVPPDLSQGILRVEGPGVAPDVRLTTPDASVLSPDDTSNWVSQRAIFVKIEEENCSYWLINHPLAGIWGIEILDPVSGEYIIDLIGANSPPSISVDSIHASGTQVEISWLASDPDDNANIALFYDDDNAGIDGEMIVEGVSEDGDPALYTWNASEAATGRYFVYASIEDTSNAPVFSYSPNWVQIVNPNAPSSPSGFEAVPEDTVIRLNWNRSPESDVLGYTIHFTDDTSAFQYENHVSLADTNQHILTGLVLGRTYKIAVTAFDFDGYESVFSDELIVRLVSSTQNNPPFINSVPNTRVREGLLYSYDVDAIDEDGDQLYFDLIEAPQDMAIDPVNGLITWQTNVGNAGRYEIEFQVSDGRGGIDTQSYSLTVTNEFLGLGSIGLDRKIYVGDGAEALVLVRDADLDRNGFSIDSVVIHAFTSSDTSGISVLCLETSISSGEFQGKFELSCSETQDEENRILVGEGDLIEVAYYDENPVGARTDRSVWVQHLPAEALFDSDPDVLNLKRRGKYVTGYIQLPQGLDPARIDVSTVFLNGLVPALEKFDVVGDYNEDGILDRMVKFDCTSVESLFTEDDSVVALTLTGKVYTTIATVPFAGVDTCIVLGKIGSSPETAIPKQFSLAQNSPNPFNPSTQISYGLPTTAHVKIVIYNILGQKVKTLVDEHQSAGHKSVRWDGKDEQGHEVTSGVYFYRIQADDFVQSKKMVLMK